MNSISQFPEWAGRRRVVALALVGALSACTGGEPEAVGGSRTCPVTNVADRPERPSAPLLAWLDTQGEKDSAGWYGTGDLWTFPEATRYASPQGEGGLRIKMPWWRGRDEKLTLRLVSLRTGESVEGSVPDGYYAPGFQPTGMLLPYAGCWQITGTLGATRLRLVVDVTPFRAPGTATPAG
ncbi:hypothetical protein [Streptosporangium saharense]|uniref:hypothetical protein n=1 Tax=Streptosporangium saharense TaxID=1706840 RepID=UPI00367B7E8B